MSPERTSGDHDVTIVHVLRHGEVFNPDGILYGRIPGYHLSELGVKMAERVAERARRARHRRGRQLAARARAGDGGADRGGVRPAHRHSTRG